MSHQFLSMKEMNQDQFGKVTIAKKSIEYFPMNVFFSSHPNHISSLHHNPIEFMKSGSYVDNILGSNISEEHTQNDILDQIIKREGSDLIQYIPPDSYPKESALK